MFQLSRTADQLWAPQGTHAHAAKTKLASFEADLALARTFVRFLPLWIVCVGTAAIAFIAGRHLGTTYALVYGFATVVALFLPRLWVKTLEERHAQLIRLLENGEFDYRFAWKGEEAYTTLCEVLGREPGNEKLAANYFVAVSEYRRLLWQNPHDKNAREALRYHADNFAKLIKSESTAA